MLIEETEFNDVIIGIFFNAYFCSEFLVPFFNNGIKEPAFGKVRIYNRMNYQRKILMRMTG